MKRLVLHSALVAVVALTAVASAMGATEWPKHLIGTKWDTGCHATASVCSSASGSASVPFERRQIHFFAKDRYSITFLNYLSTAEKRCHEEQLGGINTLNFYLTNITEPDANGVFEFDGSIGNLTLFFQETVNGQLTAAGVGSSCYGCLPNAYTAWTKYQGSSSTSWKRGINITISPYKCGDFVQSEAACPKRYNRMRYVNTTTDPSLKYDLMYMGISLNITKHIDQGCTAATRTSLAGELRYYTAEDYAKINEKPGAAFSVGSTVSLISVVLLALANVWMSTGRYL